MADYWKKRQQQLNGAAEKDEADLKKRLSALYSSEEKKLNRDIASYYTMYGKDNVLEYRNLLQQLSSDDYRLLMERMDDFGEKYPQYKHLLPVRASIYKLNRLEGLQYSVQMQQLELGIKEQAAVEEHLLKLAARDFTTIQADLGMGRQFNAENASLVRSIVYTKWTNEKNFSDRIWDNKTRLSNLLNTTIAQGFARGTNYQKMVSYINQRFDVGRNDAYRLIYTEGTFVMNESRARAVQDIFEYYHLSCLPGACSDCVQVEEETTTSPILFKERMDGENFPPIHPWCRCGFEIVVPDPQQWIDDFVNKNGGDPDLTEEQRQNIADILNKYDKDVNASNISTKEHSEAYKSLIDGLEKGKVAYREVGTLSTKLTEGEIIERLSGGDMTKGSCSSLGFAYIGNKNGYDVLDFRGGNSQYFFSLNSNIKKMTELPNVQASITMVKKEAADTAKIIQNLEHNKEYYLAVGRHAAIVRNTEEGAWYLELQSRYKNGWMPFDTYGSTAMTLNKRFGCRKTVDRSYGKVWEKSVVLMDVDSFKDNEEFREILGYINTVSDKQKKGVTGHVR